MVQDSCRSHPDLRCADAARVSCLRAKGTLPAHQVRTVRGRKCDRRWGADAGSMECACFSRVVRRAGHPETNQVRFLSSDSLLAKSPILSRPEAAVGGD